jgi:redox-sensitive bicupin YhaK (pirin superfamily)
VAHKCRSTSLDVNGEKLAAGDGAQIRQEEFVSLVAAAESEFLLFDMA